MGEYLLFEESKDAFVAEEPGDGDAAEGVEDLPLLRSLLITTR